MFAMRANASSSLTNKICASQRLRKNVVCTAIRDKSRSIGVIGAGAVGNAVATSIIHKNIASNLIMTDLNLDYCEGVAMDLQDEAFVTGTHVECGSIESLRDCKIIVVTAGAKQQPNEPRTNLVSRNVDVLADIFKKLGPLHPSTVVVLVSNPVDVLTGITARICEQYIPSSQVIGSGTYLDSQRLRVALSKRLNVNVKSIHSYVLGEHGDSQVVAWSAAMIGGSRISDFTLTGSFSKDEYASIEQEVRRKAYEIIQKKGSTSHGIGACVATICEAVILDKCEVLPVSVYQPQFGCHMGWPSIIGQNGVEAVVPITLSDSEESRLRSCAASLQQLIDQHTPALSS